MLRSVAVIFNATEFRECNDKLEVDLSVYWINCLVSILTVPEFLQAIFLSDNLNSIFVFGKFICPFWRLLRLYL